MCSCKIVAIQGVGQRFARSNTDHLNSMTSDSIRRNKRNLLSLVRAHERINVAIRVNTCVFVCVCVVIPFILDVRLVDAPAGSYRRKVTQDFSTFLLRCLP